MRLFALYLTCALLCAGGGGAVQAALAAQEGLGNPAGMPGKEITPEEMRNIFPAPMREGAPRMSLTPGPAPLFPTSPVMEIPAPQRPAPRIPQPTPAPALTPGQGKSLTGPEPKSPDKEAQSNPAPAPPKSPGIPAEPTVEMMAGQMLMLGFSGAELKNNAQVLNLAAQGRVGGVLLLARDALGPRNIVSPAQVRVLTATLQKAAREGQGSGGLPLFLAVEQEGGLVQALEPRAGFDGSPAAAQLGQGTVEATLTAGRRLGLEMAALGLNFNFAPVADANVNPLSEDMGKKFRSFSPSPHRAAAHALAFGQGLTAAHIIPCLKYFPGTGSLTRGAGSEPDGLFGPADMAGSWQPLELTPFREVLQQGWPGAVQPALAFHRGMDALYPVTLSSRALTEVLRGQLGFGGVIVSNDLEALGRFYPLEESLLLAVRAGADVLLLPAREGIVPEQAAASGMDLPGLPGSGKLGEVPELPGLPGLSGLAGFAGLTRLPGLSAPPPERAGLVSPRAVQAHSILVRLVREGRIPQERLRQSWQRITDLKKKFLLREAQESPPPPTP